MRAAPVILVDAGPLIALVFTIARRDFSVYRLKGGRGLAILP